ncbi:MAG: inorganic phosphate transporter [Cyclobacteriaceae bacterium]
METYQVLVLVLLAIAAVDLIVGVSNDAVNFLNSAIGSRVAPLRIILVVASVGVLFGSLFSSGMMEVARNGLFKPDFFTFELVMIIFMSVMLTDVLLLDVYNSLGLPTSTTVSLVFEILGAAFVTGVLYSFYGLGNSPVIDDIINFSSALTIIGGIFLSVFISFIVGSLIQHLSRIIFTFDIADNTRRFGAIFGGLAITTITYFLLIKGVKGSVLVSEKQVAWIMDHTLTIVLFSVVCWSIIVQLLMWWRKINPLKVVVLLGTFSLAMAFASNDLVNFIGVPVAGLISFQHWIGSGESAAVYKMSILNSKIATEFWILLVAAAIMILTLWTNAKSRKVTETEVSLGRQDEGDEKFKPNYLSRILVGSVMYMGKAIDQLVPKELSGKLQKRFAKKVKAKDDADPSFDLIRASVNLLTASVLISFGTANKLPLSTTFVTFMVAMGTSFADQAWGRESAVYRVAGVLNVIGSWLLTALVAFSASGIMALVLYFFGVPGFFALTAVAAFLLIRSHVVFRKKSQEEAIANQFLSEDIVDIHQAIEESKSATVKNLKTVRNLTVQNLQALAKEKGKALAKTKSEIDKLRSQNEKLHGKIVKHIKKLEKGRLAAGRLHLLVFDLVQDLYQSSNLISEVCTNHVINHHPPPHKAYLSGLRIIETQFGNFCDSVMEQIATLDFANGPKANELHQRVKSAMDQMIDQQIIDIQKGDLGSRMGLLQTRLLLELRDMVAAFKEIYDLYSNYSKPTPREEMVAELTGTGKK